MKNKTQKFLQRLSQTEDLRVLINGKWLRAYFTDVDRTRARAEYTVDGVRRYVYGAIVNGRIEECR